jgi:hypothetical protein
MVNYQGPKLGFRFAEALLPKVTTGTDLNYNIRHTHAENFAIDYSTYAMQGYATHVRGLAFVSHADLGNYREANDAYRAGRDKKPDITLHRLGLSFEQDLPRNFRVFLRAGWNDGGYESFTFSEMNNTIAFGGDLSGDAWHRKDDRIGSALVNSGLGYDHRRYLALGGIGFMLGDGGLRYGRESVSETYYTAHIIGGLYLSPRNSPLSIIPALTTIADPVLIPGLRAHIDF